MPLGSITNGEVRGAVVGSARSAGGLMIGIIGAISSVIAARRMIREMEEKMRDWNNPGRQYAPMRREFDLHSLHQLGEYVFDRLIPDIRTLREINIDLHRILDTPAAAYSDLLRRIDLAGDALIHGEMAAANKFEACLLENLVFPEDFDPKTSPLHQDMEYKIGIMRRQHDAVTRSVRGAVWGGVYETKTSNRDASYSAMRHEFNLAKLELEALRNALVKENQYLADGIDFLRRGLPGIAGLYEQAVEAFVEPDDEAAARAARNFVETVQQSQDGDFEGAIRRYGTQINLTKQ